MYLKLGKKASCFAAGTLLFIASPEQPMEYKGPMTKRIKQGLEGHAIVRIEEEEYLKMKAAWDAKNPPAEGAEKEKSSTKVVKDKGKPEETAEKKELRAKLEALDDDALMAYYKEEYEVSPEDEKDFKKLKHAKKVDFLLDA